MISHPLLLQPSLCSQFLCDIFAHMSLCLRLLCALAYARNETLACLPMHFLAQTAWAYRCAGMHVCYTNSLMLPACSRSLLFPFFGQHACLHLPSMLLWWVPVKRSSAILPVTRVAQRNSADNQDVPSIMLFVVTRQCSPGTG